MAFFQRSSAFDAKEKAVLLFADRVARGPAAMRDQSLEELKQYFSADQIVELALVACVASFTNRFNDALQIEPDLG